MFYALRTQAVTASHSERHLLSFGSKAARDGYVAKTSCSVALTSAAARRLEPVGVTFDLVDAELDCSFFAQAVLPHELTSRSLVHVRWTTEPACVGYADTPEQAEKAIARHLADRPNFSGTPRQVHEYLRTLKRNLGGAYCRVDLTNAIGETVSREEVTLVAADPS